MIHHGDCLDVMAAMEPESVDAIVTDPPYGLEFMGKEWDRLDTTRARIKRADEMSDPAKRPFLAHSVSYQGGASAYAFHARWAEAAYRVAKPSAYLLAFGGTRTVHRMTCALEDAGWIIRDMLVWGYASGFPKSKASLKPAWEPIVMARKPGPLRMLAIDECRIGTEPRSTGTINPHAESGVHGIYGHDPRTDRQQRYDADKPSARWPANIVLTDPIFDGGIEGVVGGGSPTPARSQNELTPVVGTDGTRAYGAGVGKREPGWLQKYDDTGTYSRFFLIPKAARSDREPVLGGLPERLTVQTVALGEMEYATLPNGQRREAHPRARANVHPTVKPVDLMRHLVRLVTPTGGTVLDPFLGSGTTALAAEMEGFAWIGIEREAEYVAIAKARLNGTQKGMAL